MSVDWGGGPSGVVNWTGGYDGWNSAVYTPWEGFVTANITHFRFYGRFTVTWFVLGCVSKLFLLITYIPVQYKSLCRQGLNYASRFLWTHPSSAPGWGRCGCAIPGEYQYDMTPGRTCGGRIVG